MGGFSDFFSGGGSGLIGTVLGGFLGMEGSRRADSRAHDMSQEQMQFQERMFGKQMDFERDMSNTAVQRNAQDMAAAGFNPMLGYMKGQQASSPSVSPPSGAMAPSRNRMAEGIEAASQASNMMVSSATAAKLRSEKNLVDAQVPEAVARARNENASAVAAEEQVRQMYPWIAARRRSEARSAEQEFSARKEQGNYTGVGQDNYWQAEAREQRARGALESGSVGARIRSAIAEALHSEYTLPAARNQRDYDETGYGKRIRPLLPDIGKVVSGAAGAIGSASGLKYLFGGRSPRSAPGRPGRSRSSEVRRYRGVLQSDIQDYDEFSGR